LGGVVIERAAMVPQGVLPALSAENLAARLDDSLAKGIAADPALWRRLDAVAARVQVPASAASRERGAGGGDANT
jgi:acyl-coenzyme A synthetase/AMP-(fatty) acid ligase